MSFAASPNPDNHLNVAPAPATYKPTEGESTLLGDVQTWIQAAERSRDRYVRVWELVRNFVRGEQNLYQDESGELVRLQFEQQSRRLISINNQMKLAVRQLHAKLTKHIPDFGVSPANGDQDQIQAAQAASEFIVWFREKEDFIIKYLAAMLDVCEVGTGLLTLDWDPDAGRKFSVCPVCNYLEEGLEHLDEDCPACQMEAQMEAEAHAASEAEFELGVLMGNPVAQPPLPLGQPDIGQLSEVREGDVVLNYLNPREFLPEPGCFELKKMRKWAIRRVVPIATLRARYPEYADVLEPKRGLYNFNNVKVVRSTRQGEYNYDEYQEHGIETIYYERESALYPKGRRIVTINDHVLVAEGDNPLYFLQRPSIYALHWDKETDTFFSQPFGEHAWHRQKELNENETQQRENAELMANGKVLVAANSGVRPDELTAKTGQVVRYNPGLPPPTPLRLGELGPDVYNRGGIVKGSIFEQATIGAAEQGVMSGDTSGRALAIIQAEADQQVGPTLKRIFHELGELFKGSVQVFRYFAPMDRQYRVVGDMGLQVFTLADMDLADGYDLRIEPDDGLSTNQQLRLNSLIQMVQVGAFSNPQTGMLDFPRFAKAAKLKLPGIGADKTSAQRTRAHYVLRQIEGGDFSMQPMPWDDPIAQAEVFLDWLHTKGYNPQTDPRVVQHVYQMFQFYMQMAMFQSQPGGAPPAAPRAPGPADGPGPGGQNAGTGGDPAAAAQGSQVAAQAGNAVQVADRAAESQARATAHEG